MLKFLIVAAILASSVVNAQPAFASNETISLDDFDIIKLIAKGSKNCSHFESFHCKIILLNDVIYYEETTFSTYFVNRNVFFFHYAAYGAVYEARKIGGSDDGTHYALKAVNIPRARATDWINQKTCGQTLPNLIKERKVIFNARNIQIIFYTEILYF